MKDVTDEYKNMIVSFSADFELAQDGVFRLADLDLKNEKLSEDIRLLSRLEFELRHGISKIMDVRKGDSP